LSCSHQDATALLFAPLGTLVPVIETAVPFVSVMLVDRPATGAISRTADPFSPPPEPRA